MTSAVSVHRKDGAPAAIRDARRVKSRDHEVADPSAQAPSSTKTAHNDENCSSNGQHLRYIETRIFGVQHILLYDTRHSKVQPIIQFHQYVIPEREEDQASSS
jgi:hypothetical protein